MSLKPLAVLVGCGRDWEGFVLILFQAMSQRHKSTNKGIRFFYECPFFMRRLRETNNITDCAKIYNDLLGKKYTVILEDNISFSFYFTRKAFFHLLVLEKLNKLYEFKGKSKQFTYNAILNGTFPIAAHRKSQPIQRSC